MSDRPIFVLGSPRSGTTLMRSILDGHPNLFCPPWETGFFVHFDAILHHHAETHLDRTEVIAWTRASIEQLMDRFAAKVGSAKTRWAEKTPAHVFHIDLIHEVFPSAQFVHMIRNGYEVVRSLQNMDFAPRNIRWNTRTWINSVKAGRVAAERLPPGLYTEVRYEKLLADPHAVLVQLCDFLGEPFSEAMLQFHNPEQNAWKVKLDPIQKKPVNTYQELPIWNRMAFSWLAAPLMRELKYDI